MNLLGKKEKRIIIGPKKFLVSIDDYRFYLTEIGATNKEIPILEFKHDPMYEYVGCLAHRFFELLEEEW